MYSIPTLEIRKNLEQNSISPTEWHKKLGHVSTERIFKATKIFETMPKFFQKVLNELHCSDGLISKAKRAPIEESDRHTTRPIELVHMDVMGPINPK